jgi:hypothetical protein
VYWKSGATRLRGAQAGAALRTELHQTRYQADRHVPSGTTFYKNPPNMYFNAVMTLKLYEYFQYNPSN